MPDLKRLLIAEITKPSERDKQRRVGPSGLGDPCPRCLGRALADESPDQEFSLYPWLGTAVHAYLEEKVFPDMEHELKLWVGDVPGYGSIKGTTDMVYIDPETGEITVVDWKIVGLKKIKEYRVKGMKTGYRYQGQLYGNGLRLDGRKPDKVAIVCIPRDSGNVNDIWVYEEAFQEEMAEAALARAGAIYAIVNEHGWDTELLPSDDDCYTCKMEAW